VLLRSVWTPPVYIGYWFFCITGRIASFKVTGKLRKAFRLIDACLSGPRPPFSGQVDL
jgi:hypothetical protein